MPSQHQQRLPEQTSEHQPTTYLPEYDGLSTHLPSTQYSKIESHGINAVQDTIVLGLLESEAIPVESLVAFPVI